MNSSFSSVISKNNISIPDLSEDLLMCWSLIWLSFMIIIFWLQMNSTALPSAQQVAKYLTLLTLVLSLVDLSVGLPSSSNLVNNRLFAHMIRTRSLPKRYCGRHIVNILSMLCDGNYFGPSKRNHLNDDNKPDTLNNGNSLHLSRMTFDIFMFIS